MMSPAEARQPMRIKRFDRDNIKKKWRGARWQCSGKVTEVVGTIVEAHLPGCRLGTIVDIMLPGDEAVPAEVVGFRNDRAVLLPFSNLNGVSPGCQVTGQKDLDKIPTGDFLLGRIVDPMMNVLSGDPLVIPDHVARVPIDRAAPNPMSRSRIANKLGLGVKAMDGLLTFGEGQRIGVMAGAGVGKSVLLGMMARNSEADVNVIALIGERGREVREFLERDLGAEGLRRSVIVCVTGDQSPLMRIRGAKAATAIAEHFSGQGKRVLLMMDSLTRVAMAQREIGLAAGEPPTTKGYPPSVFSLLPQLLERCGPQEAGRGSISGLYTVLVDGDDFNDPVTDAARSILDGHIHLSRRLANIGHFPAIEVNTSVSRVMHDVVDSEHWELAGAIKQLMGVYEENIDLVQLGGYQTGSNPTLDAAITLKPLIDQFLKQGMTEPSTIDSALSQMHAVFRGNGTASATEA